MNANCCSCGGMYGRRRSRGLDGKFIHFSTPARVVLFLSRISRNARLPRWFEFSVKSTRQRLLHEMMKGLALK